ncbi:DUF1850 domain-containing protein [Ureibacillus acetophenoni]|uniref:Uncharacterized protein DUF1850 n=1 Tax=Ureibacillus acetophenoni TaxID=614649 RepID=A0A285UKV5_9BACL|nr:DUF1850 domain-containing protein [Ureibacillus acetophenoni]SOC42327.1 uncharacterized protein DUF1850 [Ureibacillus acetophenoni]
MKRVSLLISTVLVIAVITFFLFIPIFKVFSFTETRMHNPQLFYINVSKETSFQFRFTHSIHRTDVLENYEITNLNKLKLNSMEYEDVSIGMPAYAEEGQSLTYENGKYTLYFDDKIIDNFTLYVGDVDYDLYVHYDGNEYNLKQTLNRGSSYLFEVKSVSLYDKLKGVLLRDEK